MIVHVLAAGSQYAVVTAKYTAMIVSQAFGGRMLCVLFVFLVTTVAKMIVMMGRFRLLLLPSKQFEVCV